MEMFIHRLAQARITLIEEASRKRPAPGDLNNELDPSKRQRLDIAPSGAQLAIGAQQPISIAQLFTLTTDPGAQSFDVNLIPIDIVKRILIPILQGVDPTRLQAAVNVRTPSIISMPVFNFDEKAVRTRYHSFTQAQ